MSCALDPLTADEIKNSVEAIKNSTKWSTTQRGVADTIFVIAASPSSAKHWYLNTMIDHE